MTETADARLVRVDSDLFVSYRRSDKDFVERFVSALEARGPAVWWDSEIGAGDEWRESIVAHLAGSEYLVIVFSDACNDSKQLAKELAVADHLNKEVIPLKIDGAEPKGSFLYELAWRNWINAHPDPMGKLDATATRIVERLQAAGWTPGQRNVPSTGEVGSVSPPPAPAPAPTPPASGTLPPPPTPTPPESPTAPTSSVIPAPPAPTVPNPTTSIPPPPEPTVPNPTTSIPPRPSAAAAPPDLLDGPRLRFNDVFPFHWADFIAPVLFGIMVMFSGEEGETFAVTVGDALMAFVMLLAIIGLVVFPIRHYRRRANPYRVARNLIISNITFAVAGGIAGFLSAPSLVEEGETANTVRTDLVLGFLVFALLFAAISFVIFFLLSRSRARRALDAHLETV